jgi:hypothetical protein
MSADELKIIWQYHKNTGNVLNINCGQLRNIGKTECIKRLMDDSRNEIMILTPYSQQYQSQIAHQIFAIWTKFGSEFTQYYRGKSDQIDAFADEVPNAERIVNSLGRQNIKFIAGFYSDNRSYNSLTFQKIFNALEKARKNSKDFFVGDITINMTQTDYESLKMQDEFVKTFDINTHKEIPFTGRVFGAQVYVSSRYKCTVLNTSDGQMFRINEEEKLDFSGNAKMKFINHD